MKLLWLHTSLILFFSISLLGCDKLCKRVVQDVATVQNMTGRALMLNVCKGAPYEEVVMSVPRDSQTNELSLGDHEESEVKGGPGSSCSGVSGGKVTMGFSLAPSSFGKVRLCFDSAHNLYVIVETEKICPTGFIEQMRPSPCN